MSESHAHDVRTHSLPQHPLSLSFSPPLLLRGLLPTRDANCFCYLCQVPTLPRHILQTGPCSLSCFLCVCVSSCSRNEGGGERIKQKCAAICSKSLLPAVACRIATMRQIHTLSWRTSWWVVAVEELWCRRNEYTKLTRRTVNNREPYNSRGFLFRGIETHYMTKAEGRCCNFIGEKIFLLILVLF